MTDGRKTALITWTTGDRDKPPVILLHDRYLDHDFTAALGDRLVASNCVVTTRAARTQMEMGLIKGYYWFLGPLERPELSTLGDGLHHLERLLLSLNEETGKRIALCGIGEGGTIALLIAMVWPELIAGVASIDGPLPLNLSDLPVDFGDINGLDILLAERDRDLAATTASLVARGASVSRIAADDDAIAAWLVARA